MDRATHEGGFKRCSHGLSDNVEIMVTSSVKGIAGSSQVFTYYCTEHERYGTYTTFTPKQQH